MEPIFYLLGLVVLLLLVYLITSRWFWITIFGLSSIAAFFAMIASVIHFQILAAVGLFVLAGILGAVTQWIADGFR